MLTTELCARLCANFPLQLPDAPACFACTRVVLDPWDDAEGGTVFIGEGTVDRPEAAATARDLHCGAGCRSASALYQDVFVRTIAQSANLRAFIHPMLRRLQEYDQAHSTALLHTLCVYLLQEQNLHATARQLFIHRNTLVYRLQRIRTLLQLDLDDAAVRNVLRTGCILLEYYQGAF